MSAALHIIQHFLEHYKMITFSSDGSFYIHFYDYTKRCRSTVCQSAGCVCKTTNTNRAITIFSLFTKDHLQNGIRYLDICAHVGNFMRFLNVNIV